MKVVLGTMTFGESIFEEGSKDILDAFLEQGHNRIDTAYVYNNGKSEELIGEYLKNVSRDRLVIDTKANPRITGRLDSYAIKYQIDGSLQRLGTDYVDCFYLHFPDKNVPLEEALETVDELHKQGKIKTFGLSNYPKDLVEKAFSICNEKGWICPSIYEGLYNPLSRRIEALDELFNKFSLSLYCYNPLAGGLMTDKYTKYSQAPGKGRFTNRPNYQNRYWKESYFKALDMLKAACGNYEIGITEATFRWLSYSSMLSDDRNDAVIIGVSKAEHLQSNLRFMANGPLPDELVDAFERAWIICREDAPEYYRFYGDDKNI